ncbi:GL22944 [Drosophila persimilis]|uniref:GL18195 n=1 Tax=Drosophila persimilis TaxID=7234 RepID=B4H9U8_DROPE|nr:GL18195 [Drosophila persimilis]EDW36595.1 GL22946 [Drosophila persimilis]EDW36597.1 GL22944 [Drosophila persimilis]
MKTDAKPDQFDLSEEVAKLQFEIAPIVMDDEDGFSDSDSDFDSLEDIEDDNTYLPVNSSVLANNNDQANNDD